jgi:hypothetical protein
MHNNFYLPVRLVITLAVLTVIVGLGPSPSPMLSQSTSNVYADPAYPLPRWEHLGYGINIFDLEYTHNPDKVSEIQFSWIKLAENLPHLTADCPYMHHKLLFRVPFPKPDEDWEEWGQNWGAVAAAYKDCIDAYEIGNEPNLAWEWGLGNPDPVATVEVLRIVYENIKANDPEAIVISPAMSPTGSVPPDTQDVWDDRRFLRAMYEAGAKPYFDALGAHPFGFKYPPETDPDSIYYDPYEPDYPNNPDPVDGLCFRRAEQLRAVMEEFGDTKKQIWATEVGWILDPPGYCYNLYDWRYRWWQRVDPQTQGDYLWRAFEYAAEHWPWMGPTFVFNLDYSRLQQNPNQECDPMGWHSIVDPYGTGRPAFEMFKVMPKRPYALLDPPDINVEMPTTSVDPAVASLKLESIGISPATWSFEAADPWVTVTPATAMVAESEIFTVTISLPAYSLPPGTYTTTITLNGQENFFTEPGKMAYNALPQIIPLQVQVVNRYSAVTDPSSIFTMLPITEAAPIAVPLTLQNTGISPATWLAEAGESWVTFTPAAVTVTDLGYYTVTLNLTESYFPGGTLLGFHSTAITLTAQEGSSPRVVPVQAWVYEHLYQMYLPAVLRND